MTTERLFYQDAYTTAFSAQVLERLTENNRSAIVIDRTFFYPTSGGQPHDLGQINSVAVLDVYIRPTDQAIIHVTSGPVHTNEVKARIDWERRFDHMQQHTGQHILSRAFLNRAGLETVSFHMGQDVCNIDLQSSSVADGLLIEVEDAVNRIVWENRPVTVQIVQNENTHLLPLRSKTEHSGEDIRLVNIDDYDLTACGGTHVSQTGEIGLIKILRTEKSSNNTRVYFKCGGRALADYRLKNILIGELSARFTTSISNVPDSITKIQHELKSQTQENKKLRSQLAEMRAEELYKNGQKYKAVTIVSQNLDKVDMSELRLLATLVAKHPKTVALLASSKPRLQFVFSRSEDAPGKMDELLLKILSDFKSASGGGSENIAQGGGKEVGGDQVQRSLAKAEELLVKQLNE